MFRELKFFIYIIACITIGFIDFFFYLRGLFTLLFDVLLAILIVSTKRKEISFRFNLCINNFYAIFILILFSIMINLISINKTENNDYNFDFYFILSIFIKAFTEEVVFRGYWLKSFLSSRNIFFSVVFTSLGFTLLHYFSGADLIFAFIGSVTLSISYIKTKSILDTYMIHLISNLFFIFGLPNIISLYSNIEVKNNIKTVFIIFLVIVYLFKLLLKNSNKDK